MIKGIHWWYSVVVLVVAMATVASITIWYAGKVARDSEHKWCGIVTTMDEAYSAPRPSGAPPLTAIGQRLADQMRQLRNDFNC